MPADRDMIKQTRSGVAHTVNAGMTFLYWIGKRIQMEVLKYERAEYGSRTHSCDTAGKN